MSDASLDEAALIFTVEDAIATITLNRPAQRNAINAEIRSGLRTAVEQVRRDAAIRALIVTGVGGVFCAGGDIATMRDREPSVEEARLRIRESAEIAVALTTLDKPVIAAVDGPAFGAGFGMALAADFVLATPAATFCASFARIGLVPDFALHYSLPRRIGPAAARELIFSARTVDAEEARRLGIVYRIVDAADLAGAARTFAAGFLEASPTALALSKSLLDQSMSLDIRQIAQAEVAAQAICMETDYHRDAIARFLAKEKLRFSWPA